MNPKFIDIHSHILPGVDDGPGNIEEAVEMLRMAASSGTEILAATPHIHEGLFENSTESLKPVYDELSDEKNKQGINIEMVFGAEAHVARDILQMVENNLVPTYGEMGKYLLIEFPFAKIPGWADQIIFELKINDIFPIIAHPERCISEMKDLNVIYDLVYKGALTQINSTSITEGFGKKVQDISFKMVQLNLAHFVASDSHHAYQRTPDLLNAYTTVKQKFDTETANRLFYKNPRSVIEGSNVYITNPQRYTDDHVSIFGKIKTGAFY